MSSTETWHSPALSRRRFDGVTVLVDERLAERHHVLVAFTERTGGVSPFPYRSLDLAGHVGDDPTLVNENRSIALRALGLFDHRDRLTMADQVHGENVEVVGPDLAGAGAWAARGPMPLPATDAMITCLESVPLLMCFADCVPVVLVAPGPCVAVIHAGWRGALASLPGKTALKLAEAARVDSTEIIAYVGPHIGGCCYQVGADLISQFRTAFGKVTRAGSSNLDLGLVVQESLSRTGVRACSVAHTGVCTAHQTERFFSHRAESGRTGRHGALGCILPRSGWSPSRP